MQPRFSNGGFALGLASCLGDSICPTSPGVSNSTNNSKKERAASQLPVGSVVICEPSLNGYAAVMLGVHGKSVSPKQVHAY